MSLINKSGANNASKRVKASLNVVSIFQKTIESLSQINANIAEDKIAIEEELKALNDAKTVLNNQFEENHNVIDSIKSIFKKK